MAVRLPCSHFLSSRDTATSDHQLRWARRVKQGRSCPFRLLGNRRSRQRLAFRRAGRRHRRGSWSSVSLTRKDKGFSGRLKGEMITVQPSESTKLDRCQQRAALGSRQGACTYHARALPGRRRARQQSTEGRWTWPRDGTAWVEQTAGRQRQRLSGFGPDVGRRASEGRQRRARAVSETARNSRR